MSNSARKRCRKSKLVPRECAEEEEINLQSPLKKLFIPVKNVKTRRKKTETKVEKKNDIKSVLKKINAAAKQDSEEAKALEEPARKFEVDIQIETCDEDMNPDDMLEENKSILRHHLPNLDMSPFPSIELKIDDILKVTDDINQTATNNADKSLSLYVKNTIGSTIQNASPRSDHEEGILKALEEWKLWSNHAKYVNRTRPVFYKCYICKVAWWHLSDFRDHIAQHDKVIVTFEQTNHESNIVASYSKFTFENIFAEGNCSLCGRDYHYHKVQTYDFNNIVFGQYVSRRCQRTFFNCYSAMIHANNCEFCDVGDNECQVCSVKFEKLIDLEEHLVLCHSVRSDEPAAVIGGKTCKCSKRFISKVHHVCVNKDPVFQCFDCFEGFYNKIMIKKHSAMSKQNFTCDICNESLNKYCKKYIHLMKHTDQFMMVAKCMQCPDFNLFVDEEDAFQHKRSKHGQDSKRNLYFPKILVPTSCIVDSLRTELGNVVKKEKSDNQDNTIDNQEETMADIKIESDFIKEEPEEPENEEDDEECNLVIKEEPLELNEPYNEMYEESTTENEISIKEENFDVDEEDDYQGDIIKIDVKCEATDQFGVKETVTDDNLTEKLCINGSDNETFSPVLVGGRMKNRIYKCNKCGYQARHKKFKEHVESSCGNSTYNKNSYNCSECETVFPSLGTYLLHFTKHGLNEMACPECLRQFKTLTQLGQHIYTHIKQNFVRVKLISHESYYKLDFQCKQCSDIVHLDQFFDHWQIHLGHNRENKLRSIEEIRQDLNPDGSTAHEPLPGCLPEAVVKECLQYIMMKVPKECNYCHRKFTRVYGCKIHIIEHLLGDAYAQKPVFGTLRCQICAAGFPSPEKYKQHMRDHASLPVYKCELCDRTFSDSSNFTKHKKVHNYKVLVCDLCGKKFQAKASLIKHLVKHEISTPITCNLCNRIFYFESSYRRHVRYAHDKVTFGFRCVICNERFDSLKYKWDHMWQVHKERSQKADCPICLESFRKYADVKFHARMIHGIEVSVLSMKNAASEAANLDTYFKAPRIRLGDNETLVVYESE